jgi:hypothetical protein
MKLLKIPLILTSKNSVQRENAIWPPDTPNPTNPLDKTKVQKFGQIAPIIPKLKMLNLKKLRSSDQCAPQK